MTTLTGPPPPPPSPDSTTAAGPVPPATIVAAGPRPPTDQEVFAYAAGTGRFFLGANSITRVVFGLGVLGLTFQGRWLLLLAPYAVLVVLTGLSGIAWSAQIPVFDVESHLERGRRVRRDRWSVDVFVTVCGEDPAVIANTVERALALEHPGPLKVYVLDDAGSALVEAVCAARGATYLRRPRPGWMKKAGNLQHGLDCSTGDLVLVLDADFAVRADLLAHVVPYFEDEALGILQTPQYFDVDPANWVEQGAAEQQEIFYRLVQRARDRWGSTICVGTNAVYRRAALDARGGVALIEHSEDVFTGLKVMDAGYRVGYLPLVLAAGSSPTDVRSLSSQQYRWARGTFALVGTSLFRRVRLTTRQRLSYWDGWAYYVSGAMAPVAAVLLPVLSLLEAPGTITLRTAALGLPALVMGLVVSPRWHLRHHGSSSRRVGLLSQVAHLCALVDHVTDRDQEWVPTGGAASTGNPSDRRYRRTDHLVDFVIAAAIGTAAAVTVLCVLRLSQGASPWDLAPVAGYTVLALATALGCMADPIDPRVRDEAGATTGDPPEVAAAITRTEVPGTTAVGGAGSGRDGLLDLIRAVSVIRVVCWHALGFWWISWAFAAMPAVFYVSGAVLLRKRRHRRLSDVVIGRFVRLLPPYLMFVAVSLACVWAAAPREVSRHLLAVAGWIVPVVATPSTLPWEGGWLSSPLWFIRALLLVLLIAPFLVPRVRAWPWPLTVGGWLVGLAVLDAIVAQQRSTTATALWRGLGDVVCYAGFFLLGALFHHGRSSRSRRWRLVVVALAAAAAGLATVLAPPVDHVVNNSYLLSALVGLAWLFLTLAFEEPLRRVSATRVLHGVVRRMTTSSMTIYLWHTVAICTTYWLVGTPRSLAGYVVFAGVLIATTAVVVRALHPIEVLATGIRPTIRWGSVALVALLLAGAVSRPTLFPAEASDEEVPPPSGRPLVGAETAAASSPGSPTPETGSADGAATWLAEHQIEGAVAEIAQATGTTVVGLGTWDGGAASEPFQVTSVTKTMVAAVALQLVEEGGITLDGPLVAIDGVSRDITDELTLRRLLANATGLVDYRDAAGYRPDLELTPTSAVALSLASSDLDSTEVVYSAANYLVVGLLLEEVTGTPLDQLLERRLFEPLGLDDTRLVRNDRPGFVGHGSGGVVSTLDDLVRWYAALLRDGTVLSPTMRDEMLNGGSAFGKAVGLGAWRFCPCATRADGSRSSEYIFHDGGDVRLAYREVDGVVIAIRLSDGIYGEDRAGDDLDVLMGHVLADVVPVASESPVVEPGGVE